MLLQGLGLMALLSSLLVTQGSGGALAGTVRDSEGGVLPGATITLTGGGVPPSVHEAVAEPDGAFVLSPIAPGRYLLRVAFPGFEPHESTVVIGRGVVVRDVVLGLGSLREEVSVVGRAGDALVPATRVDRRLIETLPSESLSGGLSSLVTLTAPGVAADSNGGFHPLGEHAETSVNIDGQPVSDQQSRIFSNQLSPHAIQSMDVLTGVPPVEFGDKTSLVANVTTRSGLGARRAMGEVSLGVGSFLTPTAAVSLGRGGSRLGNFLAVDGTVSDRFLDTPEARPLHAHGHLLDVFERFDWRASPRAAVHVNLIAAHSGFETPNTYDQEAVGQDQRQRQTTINLAPAFTLVVTPAAVLEVNGWVRRDRVTYGGSGDRAADRPATLEQARTLTNAGARATVAWTAGRHAVRAGLQETTTWLDERFQTGLTDAAFNTPCVTPGGDPATDGSLRDVGACAGRGLTSNPGFLPSLLPYDLTRGGLLFAFAGRARITQWAGFAQDAVTVGPWTATAGVRVEHYDGLSRAAGVQPRFAATYRAERTRTVWRAGYGRVFLTPYNENLVLASTTGEGGFGGGLLGAAGSAPLTPARRHQFEIGAQQDLWRGVRIDASWFWKRTDGAYDFDVILNTPLTFPVQFRKSEVDGGMLRVTWPEARGFTAYTTVTHTSARLFGPALGGLRFSASYAPVARPDHDQPLQQTTHVEYRAPKAAGFWAGVTWRYDSGLVAVSVPTYQEALRLTGDEQAAMGLYCGGTVAAVGQPIRTCAASDVGATRLRIPPLGTGDDDTNPTRIAPHHLIDLGVGFDRLTAFGVPLRARVTVVNLFNTTALYNFLSTFAGTHFVTPRAAQAELALRF